jgi:hypothetical protein
MRRTLFAITLILLTPVIGAAELSIEPAEQIVTNSKSLLGTFVAGSDQGDTQAKKKSGKSGRTSKQGRTH